MINEITEYFGAANGFDGFRSYFKDIFNPKDYNRVYVIKGGPGTGKSSMMKKIHSSFSNEGYKTERIYCSSDPGSLDGVIVKQNNKKVALLDGTAPHETDASFPGAIDEIINLAEGLDYKKLSRSRDAITELNEIKKSYYEKAYKLLNLAGEIDKYIHSYFTENTDYNAAERFTKQILSEANSLKKFTNKPRMISAFCKDGLVSFSPQVQTKTNMLYIGGERHSAYILMNILASKLSEMELIDIYCPSPLSMSYIERIYTESIVIAVSESQADFSLPNRFVSSDIRILAGYVSSVIDMAKDAFAEASRNHFALEKIYTDALDFNHNNMLTDNLIAEIHEILS